jgi:hypothetical protein
MNLSSPTASGLMNEPPVSPGPLPAAPPAAPPPSLEAQVVRLGLMTTAEVASTMQEEAETGRPFAELAVEHGRIDPGDLARISEPAQASAPEPVAPLAPPAAAPEPVLAPAPDLFAAKPEPVANAPEPVASLPEPVASEPEPVVKITLEPSASAPAETPAAVQPRVKAVVWLRLSSGERVSAGEFDSRETAERRARELMVAVDAPGSWPCVDGRYIKPDAVVSIDVDLPTL